MERKIKVKNPKLKAIILEKGVLLESVRKLHKELEKKIAIHKVKATEVQKLKDKMTPLVKNLDLDLTEFEDVISFDLVGDDIEVLVIDQVEAFKARQREKKNTELLEANTENKRKTK